MDNELSTPEYNLNTVSQPSNDQTHSEEQSVWAEIAAELGLSTEVEEPDVDERLQLALQVDQIPGDLIIPDGGMRVTAEVLISTITTEEWHNYKKCPIAEVTGGDYDHKIKVPCRLRVSKNRSCLTIMCTDKMHGHSMDRAREDKNGNLYWVWNFRPAHAGTARPTLEKADDLSIVKDFLAYATTKFGSLALDQRGDVRRYVPVSRSKKNLLSGTWEALTEAEVHTALCDRQSKLQVKHVDSKGAISYRGLDVKQARTKSLLEMLEIQITEWDRRVLERKLGHRSGGNRFEHRAGIVAEGKLYLPDGKIRQAESDDNVLSEYALPYAPCETTSAAYKEWEEMVETMVGKDQGRYLQMWMGAMLAGEATTRLQKAIILQGVSGSGKSTFGSFLAEVVPAAARCQLSFDQLSEKFKQAEIFGKVLNFFPEGDTTLGSLDPRTVKTVMDGSTITVERKYGQPFSFQASCAHLFCANNLPKADSGAATYARFAVLKVRRRIDLRKDSSGILSFFDKKKDFLRPAVLRWALEGLKDLAATGYRMPKVAEVEANMAEWQETSDTLTTWISSLPPAKPGSWVSATDALNAYNAWSQARNDQPLGSKTFAQRMMAAGAERVRKSSGPGYVLNLEPSEIDLDSVVDDMIHTQTTISAPTSASDLARKLYEVMRKQEEARAFGDDTSAEDVSSITKILEQFTLIKN